LEKNRSIAHTIIDLVENAIRTAHPEIEQFVPKTDKEGNVINTFLYGEDYYNLEDSVVQVLNDNQEDTD
jgi:hypothetical protein